MVRVLPPGTMEEYVTTSDQSAAGSDRREGDNPSGPQSVDYQEGVSAAPRGTDSRGSKADSAVEPMISLRDVHKVYRLRSPDIASGAPLPSGSWTIPVPPPCSRHARAGWSRTADRPPPTFRRHSGYSQVPYRRRCSHHSVRRAWICP